MGLSEVRTVVLGVQILIGFQYQGIFQDAFDEIPRSAKLTEPASLILLLIAFACMVAPASFHQMAERGNATIAQDRYTRLMVALALVPFAASIGLDVYMALCRHYPSTAAIGCGLAASLLAAFMWFGLENLVRPERTLDHKRDKIDEPTPLKEKLTELLTESRIILPGVQALLGLQFAAYLTSGFDKLSRLSQDVHTVSLFLLVVAMILLMAPAPFHRLAEHGEDTRRVEKLSETLILASLIPLSFALAGDLFVVLQRTMHSISLATAGALLTVAATLSLWFGLPLLARKGRAYAVLAAT